MKKLLLASLLFLSTSAIAAPNLFDQMHNCAYIATKTTELTVFASVLSDAEKEKFRSYVQDEVNLIQSDGAKKTLIFIANFAWMNRQVLPTRVGMAVYEDCVNHLGQTT